MFRDRAHALCSRRAEEIREEIRRDRDRVKSSNVAKLLREIDKDLLNPDIRVETLRLRRGIRDKNVSTVFKRELGLAPKEYIVDKRMRIAARALATSRLEVWRIGAGVGYLTPANFGRAFKDWGGQSPEEFRAEQATADDTGPRSLTPEDIERALAGDLDDASAAALIERLGELQDWIRQGYQGLSAPASDRTLTERMTAAYLWRYIADEPLDVQRAAVESRASAYHTPALFLLLSTESVAAADQDSERAIGLAELALGSLLATEDRLGNNAPPYRVRAHAVAGYAFTRAGRLDDAAKAFAKALEPLETMSDKPNPVVLAELSLYLAFYKSACGDIEKADTYLQAHASLMLELVDAAKEIQASPASENPDPAAGVT